MLTPDFFWKLFTSTGSISAYLMYRRLHASPAGSS
ncbi:MAG: YqzL family protein [Candidatus Eremiobacteraeota bacterium]|nr:YqzL family protein [Candidatus Eremiobacteraeota bacterium]MBV9648019.1 YqzL family protein [Candidatus Eremiobacteraeota bacterium]